MSLQLTKPLAFFDIEATGINISTDRIVEISIIKRHPDGTTEQYDQRINPTIPIPEVVSLIHGIYDADIANAPTFAEVAADIATFIGDADLVGYNSNKFDIPILAEEFLRTTCDFDLSTRQFIDVQNIFHKMEQRTLSAAYQFYCGKSLDNAHSADADTLATYEVLLAQIEKYPSIGNDVNALSEFSKFGDSDRLDFVGRLVKNKAGEACYNFGKNKGKTVSEVNDIEPGYYGWMMNGDFPLYTKKMLKIAMDKIKKTKLDEKQNAIKPSQQTDGKAIDMNMLDQLKNKFSK
jgi:DNA polymerase III subunit epsilon